MVLICFEKEKNELDIKKKYREWQQRGTTKNQKHQQNQKQLTFFESFEWIQKYQLRRFRYREIMEEQLVRVLYWIEIIIELYWIESSLESYRFEIKKLTRIESIPPFLLTL
jgi:hypothetical protein